MNFLVQFLLVWTGKPEVILAGPEFSGASASPGERDNVFAGAFASVGLIARTPRQFFHSRLEPRVLDNSSDTCPTHCI